MKASRSQRTYVFTHVHASAVAQVAALGEAGIWPTRPRNASPDTFLSNQIHVVSIHVVAHHPLLIAEFQFFVVEGKSKRTAAPRADGSHLCPHTLPSSLEPSTPDGRGANRGFRPSVLVSHASLRRAPFDLVACMQVCHFANALEGQAMLPEPGPLTAFLLAGRCTYVAATFERPTRDRDRFGADTLGE